MQYDIVLSESTAQLSQAQHVQYYSYLQKEKQDVTV